MPVQQGTGRKGVEFRGIGVSPGVAAGPAFPLRFDDDRIVEREVSEDEVPREMLRFEEALITTRHQIHDIQKRVDAAIGREGASIFDAHLLVVDDRTFIEEVILNLKREKKNVEAVLRPVAEKYAQALQAVDDEYLRERASDIRDVTRRILRNLGGGAMPSDIRAPSILVASDLPPSETATLNPALVKGFATDLGGSTSHTAIMARALEIPAVVGLHDVSQRIGPHDQILIDGTHGILILNPTPEQLEEYGKRQEARRHIEEQLASLRQKPAETLDGYAIWLSANIEMPSDVDAVLRYGARGVGLFRTEYLYLSSSKLPGEEEQAETYARIAERLSPNPVVIRTIDLGGDKFVSRSKVPQEMNPFLGWRAIRFCLTQPDIFRAQLRAILRASVHANVKLMYPLISHAGEVVRANEILREAQDELDRDGVAYNPSMEIGAMIEVPSAALTADLIAPHVDFFSIGTNDLVQYTLAVDRVNERVAHLYEPTHPAILKLIHQVIDVAHREGLWVGVCGEMAGDPLLALLLTGLGVDELSVNPAAIPMVKDGIRKVSYSQLEELAARALQCVSGAEVLSLCRELVHSTAPEILELVE